MYLAANQIYIKQSHIISENKLNIEKVSFDAYRSNMLSENNEIKGRCIKTIWAFGQLKTEGK
jgi:hypothetical protein